MDKAGVRDYLLAVAAGVPEVSAALTGSDECIDLAVKLAPDSSSGRTWIAINQLRGGGAVVVKELALEAADVEATAHAAVEAIAPAKVARLLHADRGVLVYEHLLSHVSVRRDLVTGVRYPLLPADVGAAFLARVTFHTGSWGQGGAPLLPAVAAALEALEKRLGNNAAAVCGMLDALLDAPYGTTPPLAPGAAPFLDAIKGDGGATSALAALRARFASDRSCLVHCDLSTDSLLSVVTRAPSAMPTSFDASAYDSAKLLAAPPPPSALADLRVIGGSLACMGPAGFDVGILLGNLAVAYCAGRARVRKESAAIAKGGYAKFAAVKASERWMEHCAGIAEWIPAVWASFAGRFVSEWDTAMQGGASGETHCCDGDHEHEEAQDDRVMGEAWRAQVACLGAMLGVALTAAGAEIVRRTVAPCLDIASLEPAAARVGTTARLLVIGRYLLTQGREAAASVSRRAAAAATRGEALACVLAGCDIALAAAAAIDGEAGWSAFDAAAPGTVVTRPSASVLLIASEGHRGCDEGAWAAALASIGVDARCTVLSMSEGDGKLALDAAVMAALRAAWAPVFIVGLSGSPAGGSSLHDAAAEATEALAATASGRAYASSHALVLPPHAGVPSGAEAETDCGPVGVGLHTSAAEVAAALSASRGIDASARA